MKQSVRIRSGGGRSDLILTSCLGEQKTMNPIEGGYENCILARAKKLLPPDLPKGYLAIVNAAESVRDARWDLQGAQTEWLWLVGHWDTPTEAQKRLTKELVARRRALVKCVGRLRKVLARFPDAR